MNNLFKKVVSSVALLAMILTLVPTASFAATISDGDLVKASGSSAVYLIQDGKKRVFPHSSVYLSWGYPANYSTVKTVSADELSAYPDGDPVIYRDGFMFRFHGVGMVGGYDPSAVFYVSDGKIRPIESVTAYMKLFNGGVNESSAWDRVYWIPDDLLAKFTYPQGDKITASQIDLGQLPNGLVVRDTNSKYYVIKNGQLANITSDALAANRYTANANVFTKMLVTKLANSVLNLMPAGAAITAADPDLLTVKKISAQPSTTNVVLSSDKTSVEADGASYATLTALVPSTVTSVSFAITSGSGMLSAYTVTPVNGVATVRVTPTASSVSGTLTVSASATGLTSASVTLTTVANTLAPQVVSVSNQGMRLINVVFDKAVDKTSAETTSNYTPKNNKASTLVVSNAKLLADGKTVQLYLAAGGFYNDSIEDSIEVKNVQNVAQTATLTDVTKVLTVTDTSVPTVVAVEALGSKAMRVTFSEAVQNVKLNNAGTHDTLSTEVYGGFKLDDKFLANDTSADTNDIDGVTVSYPDASDYTKALITFTNPISVGAHTLTVSYNGVITDWNVTTTGTQNYNIMQPAGYVATVLADTSVPTLSSVEVLTQTKVRYTFSKPVNVQPTVYNSSGVITSAGDTGDFYWSTATAQTSGTYSSSVNKISDTVYEVTWGSAINTGTIYFYATSVKDFSGNSISPLPASQSALVLTDTAPAISSVSTDTNSDRVIIVYFNKDVDQATAQTSSNYVFKDVNGNVLTSTTGGNGIGSNGYPVNTPVRNSVNLKKVTITLGDATQDSNALPGGKYQLTVSGVKTNGGTTAMSSQSYTFTVTDNTRPTLVDGSNALSGGTYRTTSVEASTGRIVIHYSEPMGSSAIDGQNYKIYGLPTAGAWGKVSDAGASLSFRNSNKDVVIDFPTTTTLSSANTFQIGWIDGSKNRVPTDVAGNPFNAKDTNLGISVNGTLSVSSAALDISSGISSMKITSVTTLAVAFNRAIDTISASDFTVSNTANSTIVPSSAALDTTDTNNKTVIFTIPSGSAYQFTSNDGSNVKLKTVANTTGLVPTTKDTLGLYFAAGKTSTVNATNNIAPVLQSFVVSDPNHVTLAFDGKLGTFVLASAQNDFAFTQTVNGTTTTLTGSAITAGSVNNTLMSLTLSGSLSLLNSVTLTTVSADSIKTLGANGAKIAAIGTPMSNSSFVASSLVGYGMSHSNSANTNGFAYGYGFEYGYGYMTASGYGYGAFSVALNKSLDKNSISGTWTDNGNNTYTMTGVATTYNGSTRTVSISGVGDFVFDVLNVGISGTGTGTGTAQLNLDTNTNILTVTLTSSSSDTYTGFNLGLVTYTPSSGLKTTVGTAITTTYKPVYQIQ